MVHWRMLPNIKRTNKTNSTHCLPNNRRRNTPPTHVGRPVSPRHQNQSIALQNKQTKPMNGSKKKRNLHIISHENRGKLPP